MSSHRGEIVEYSGDGVNIQQVSRVAIGSCIHKSLHLAPDSFLVEIPVLDTTHI